MSHLVIEELISKYKQKLILQRYAESTVRSYVNCLSKFLYAFKRYKLESVTEQNIENYISHLLTTEQISDSYQKQLLAVLASFSSCFTTES